MDKSKIILIVEDEQPLSKAIQSSLEKNGFQVLTARTVEGALNHLKEDGVVDAIWLDHYLIGKENGLDFVTRIKKEEAWKNIPVFLVSNTASEDKVFSYERLGVYKHYIKAEHRLDEIISDITKYLKKTKN